MSDPYRRAHIAHPILRLDVLAPDGTRQSEYRVFCKKQQRAVPMATCCGCVHCDSIDAGPAPSVNCTVPAESVAHEPDPDGLHTAVGQVLTHGVSAVEHGTSLRDALALLRAEDRRSLPVVDDGGVIVGVVYDAGAQQPALRDACVAASMSTSLAVPDTTPVRRALELMAAAHLRELTVIDEHHVPLGTFRDIDGLRWLVEARKG
ncbi:MAG: CBS domain-containing protein [Labilithrix sp.]|nr:CBS domain-containing protein [Labilithrix sp.]MCW5812527.1 CBS domain-containing protein [Labilithrix sp.]